MGEQSHREARVGLAYGLAAYLAWGFVPLYFKQLSHVGAYEILAHRVLWSVVFLAVVIGTQGRWQEIRASLGSRRTLIILAASTLLIAVNWLVFIIAILHGQVLQASLGYFINPLVNVALGVLVLRERLRPWQLAGLALAAIGVAYMTIQAGQFPWIAMALAFSFGFYALLRKTVAAGPLVGLGVETTFLLPAAIGVIVFTWSSGARYGDGTYGLFMLSGVVTAIPLLCFANAARRLRMTTLGFLQYVSPMCQFLLAVLVYHEPFSREKLISFCFIWAALVMYSIDLVRAYRRSSSEPMLNTTSPPSLGIGPSDRDTASGTSHTPAHIAHTSACSD
jgi:chloramphenicol-sensitive protein RarD